MTIVMAYLIAIVIELSVSVFVTCGVVGLVRLCICTWDRLHSCKVQVRIAPKYTPRPVRGPQQKEARNDD